MANNTEVYRIVFVDEEGNHTSLAFQEPVESKSYHDEQVFVLGKGWAPANDEGNIPQRELDEGDDALPLNEYAAKYGITWHFQK